MELLKSLKPFKSFKGRGERRRAKYAGSRTSKKTANGIPRPVDELSLFKELLGPAPDTCVQKQFH